jgi:lipopolysaccharide heptosyltransferase II
MMEIRSQSVHERRSLLQFLIIQTAFIGDVVLATSLVEKLHHRFPTASIDFLVRKGNESLLANNPGLRDVLVWDKKQNKYGNLLKLLRLIRGKKYDTVINVQRFAATGFLTAFSGAKQKIGFHKNPFSFLFTEKVRHEIKQDGRAIHEIERNDALVKRFTDASLERPKLYPSDFDMDKVRPYKTSPYITISPGSVWFTKRFPVEKWMEFIKEVPPDHNIYLLGSSNENELAESIKQSNGHSSIINLTGELSFLESVALMRDARMNYANDSAPIHFCSATNAPVTAIYCSTIPSYGFGPLSDQSSIVETLVPLSCRPCTLHGRPACPLGHFKCAHTIQVKQLSPP